MRFRKILHATDFSAGATSALHVATRIAKAEHCALEIVHVVHVPRLLNDELVSDHDELVEELRAQARDELGKVVTEARSTGSIDVTSRLLLGDPSDAIVEAATEDTVVDLVVVGTQGRTGLARVLAGSVAEKVVRHSPCSVLVVRPDNEAVPFGHVLCPIDFSESSRCAQKLAATIARIDGAATTLLNVVHMTIPYTGRRPLEFASLLERSSQNALLEAAAESKTMGSQPLRVRTAMGSPGAQVLTMLDGDPTMDLVVIGSNGRTGVKRMLMGSVAEKVVRHARCPVLVARARG